MRKQKFKNTIKFGIFLYLKERVNHRQHQTGQKTVDLIMTRVNIYVMSMIILLTDLKFKKGLVKVRLVKSSNVTITKTKSM